MFHVKRRLIVCCLATFWCISSVSAQTVDAYTRQIQTWHRQRIEKLKAENGWLNLAGLFWLEPGKHAFGSGKTNKIVFPEGKCPALLGYFRVEKEAVWLEPVPGSAVSVGNKAIDTPLQLYPADTQTVLKSGPLRWFVIKRGERFGVRLRDLEHPALLQFKGVDCYPVDSAWRVKARLEPTIDRKIPITNVMGQTSLQNSPGTLVFRLNSVTHRLDAVEDDGRLFILFSDQTSGVETYGTGRFLYADPPDAEGFTVLDFNQAINPPCAFTPFATCPLPPPQNALPLLVTAGEKAYGGH